MIKNKILKKVYGTLAFISFFMVIGAAGASEHNTISFTQTIIQVGLSLVSFYIFARLAGAFDYNEDTEGLEDVETATDIDQLELFRQINDHTQIDGYRVFSEIQNGNHYTVTFLSKNNERCVLAEIEDIANPKGIIKIITF